MMLRIIFLSTFLSVAAAHTTYMMVCPDTIRPGMRFECQVVRKSKFPRLSMTAEVFNQNGYQVASGVFDLGGRYDIVSLDIPFNLSGSTSYKFQVDAKDRFGLVSIRESSTLKVNNKRLSLYIQTDKAIYKPGQTVQFRVFATDADLGVLKSTMDIHIFDPSRNKISQWRNVSASSGVYQGEMVMSSQPPLGDWTIEAMYDGNEKVSKRFTVEEFVLPKFEVSLSTPGYGIITDKYLSGSVSAKYTFGKDVEGNGTLIIKKKYPSYWMKDTKFSLSFQIDGSYKYTIDRQELFAAIGLTYATTLVINVNVTETLTGNTLSTEQELRYYTRPDQMQFSSAGTYFKPGLRYTGYVFLMDPKGRPLSIDEAEISVTVTLISLTNTEVNGQQINITAALRKNGMATYSFRVPMSVSSANLMAQYGELKAYKYIQQFQSPTNTYLQVNLVTRTPKAGKSARFVIRSTRPKKNINYMIVSKGEIIVSNRVFMQKRKLVLKIPLTSAMAPTARIVVFYIKKNMEIVADAATFSVEGLFENKVNIRFGEKTSKPADSISLIVKADPGSQCNVLAVDKSVLLLKQGNDITTGMVQDDQIRYDNVYSCGMSCVETRFAVPTSGMDVATLFSGTGLKVLTNALLYKYVPPRRSTSSFSFHYDYYYYSSMAEFASSMATMSSVPAPATSTVMMEATSSPEAEEVTSPEPASPPTVRSLFPDTWIYSNTGIANSRGRCYINATVPDTITSWVATAFAVHNSSGLGIAPESAKLDVFLKFFIRLELPYSVIRGEQLILQASVFNFFDTDLEVEVLLRKSSCYDNIIVTQATNGSTILSFSQEDIVRQMTIRANKATTLNFPIRPVELGMCEIDIQAISPTAGDAVKRDLLVKAEGIEENYNLPILIEVAEGEVFTKKQPITLPEDIVPGSVKIRVSVVGDMMGPSITGLTSLLQMPYGCGEQNMLGFVPNIVVIKYLDTVNNLKTADLERGRQNMIAGYQRELTYQHNDGSYSAFGNSDRSGSTWLTAYVVKSFAQARPYIYIDPANMGRSIDWLLRQYDKVKGTFREPGRVIHNDMQGGSATGERNLASYTLIALLEAKKAGFSPVGGDALLTSVIDGAIESLENSVGNMTDLFELAIASYALVLAGSEKVDDVLTELEKTAKFDDGKYWEEVVDEPDTLNWRPPYYQARSRNVEINSYILLTYVEKADLTNSIKVMRWLVKQRNSFGGYGSTQDTVMGLQALAGVAGIIFSPDFDAHIDVKAANNNFNQAFYVNKENALLFQTVYAPPDTSRIDVQATGQGVALVQVSVTYNVMEDPVQPLFTMTPSFTDETMNGFRLKVCFSWLGEGVSGMAVMEISLLSGFTADQFSVTSLGILKRVEEGDNMLVLYFDEITSEVECTEIQMERTGLVAGSQPAVVKLYDYYDTRNHVIGFYQPDILRESNVCDIGENIGCSS